MKSNPFSYPKKPDLRTYVHVIAVMILSTEIAPANELESQIAEFQEQAESGGSAIHKSLKLKGRLVPIVLPIANPTVGTGLGGGVLYMHARDPEADPNNPATMTGVFGMYTDTESWGIGGFHSGSYKDDSIRVSVPVMHGEFGLKYYGIGENSPFRDNPLDYDATGNMFVPRVSFELPAENWFLGGLYRIIDIETEFADNDPDDDTLGFNARQKTAGVGLVSSYDTRDSNLWASRGSWMDFTATYNSEYVGGDYDYLRMIMKWAQYFPVMDRLIIVYRLDGQYVDGAAPFWDLARIRLRGFSSGQYLDNVAATAQAEVRWNIFSRWYVSAFGGAGWIGETSSDLGSSDPNTAGGAGFRYMLAEDQKLSIGLDAAYSRDSADYSIYFQIGDWLSN